MATEVATANPSGIAAVQDILKEVWVSDNLESQLLEEQQLLKWVDEITDYTDSDGLKASVPLYTGRTGGLSARAVGEQLLPADHQRVGKASYNYRNLYLQVQVHGPVVARMATQRQAAVREIDFEVKRGVDSFKFDMQRQLHRDGTARLTLVPMPGGASSTICLLGAANYPLIERGWVYEGQVISAGTLANPKASADGQRIVGVTDNPAAPAVTLSTATATAATDHLFILGNATVTGSNELDGIQLVASDTGTVGGLNPATAGQSFWKGVREHNSGTPRALSVDLINKLEQKIKQRGGSIDGLMCSLGVERELYKLTQQQVRYIGEASMATGNVSTPTWNGKEVRGDPHCLPQRMYALKKSALNMFSAGPIAWQNQNTGGDVLAWRQDYDSFVGRAAKYCQFGTNRRNTHGVLEDIIE